MRTELLEAYRALPLPTTRDEHWRFTDLAGFDPDAWDAETATPAEVASLLDLDVAGAATIDESGIHFAGILQRFGIAEAVRPKTTLVPGGYPAELVAKGEVAMVVHQISEIVPVKGVTLVGPLPREVQKITVYSTGIARKAATPDVARAFVAYLTSAAVKPKFAAAGLDYKE